MRNYTYYRVYDEDDKIISKRLVKEVTKTGKPHSKNEILAKIIQESN